jgi:hypothetical protein
MILELPESSVKVAKVLQERTQAKQIFKQSREENVKNARPYLFAITLYIILLRNNVLL